MAGSGKTAAVVKTTTTRGSRTPVMETQPTAANPRPRKKARIKQGVSPSRSTTTNMAPDDIRVALPRVSVYAPPLRKSAIQDLYTCSRMYLLRDRLGLVPNEYARAPSIGSMFHLAIAAYLRGGSLEEASAAVSAFVDEEVARVTEGVTANPDDTRDIEEMAASIEDDSSIATAMAAAFWDSYHGVVEKFRPVAVERKIVVVDPITNAKIAGTVDLLLHDPRHNHYLLVDHKTTSKPPKHYSRGLGFDLQCRMYRYLVSLAFAQDQLPGVPELPVRGMIHNVVQKATIKLKQRQEIDDYLQEVREWYSATGRHEKRQDTIADSPPIVSVLTAFGGPPLDNELRTVLERSSWSASCAPTLCNFPRDGAVRGVCRNLYNRLCPYLTLCEAEPREYERIVASGHYTFKPIEYLDEEVPNE